MELDKFDVETFTQNDMTFDVVATDIETGKAVYHRCTTAVGEDLKWMRASASMPLASTPVEINGRKYLDGGIADSIPLRYMENLGFPHSIVILTQPLGFVKQPNRLLPVMRRTMKKYPGVIRALEERHIRYNETIAQVLEKEKQGQILVIRPDEALNIGAASHDASELQRVYDLGRAMGERRLREIQEFLQK